MVLSCASPCVQGISDVATAENMAVMVNNILAESISNNTMRFGAFAALSMHNATNAALELKRTVEELGFLGLSFSLWNQLLNNDWRTGGLVNDYQQSGPDNGKWFKSIL